MRHPCDVCRRGAARDEQEAGGLAAASVDAVRPSGRRTVVLPSGAVLAFPLDDLELL